MSQSNFIERPGKPDIFWKALAGAILAGLAMAALVLAALVVATPLGPALGRALDGLFALDRVQAFWYVTRAAGLIAYMLLWLSMVWGLAVSSKIFDGALHRAMTYDFHQFLSLLAIGFIALHVAVLLADRYLPFSLADILVPFHAPYRPLWVGVGVIGFYLTLLVTVTFYIRRWIGTKTFRTIHLASFLAYLSAVFHGLFAGTDSSLWATRLMYAGTSLVIVFLTAYWLLMALTNRRRLPVRSGVAVPR